MSACLYVTEARNDDDLARQLGSMAIRCPVLHGDVLWFGVDEDNDPVRILAERKKVPEFVSCILTGRYVHQAQEAYESGITRLNLIVEGEMRPGPDTGLVEVPATRPYFTVNNLSPRKRRGWFPVQPGMPYSRFCQYLAELSLLAGITVFRSRDVKETVGIVKSLWLYWQKPQHSSLKSFYNQPHPVELLSRPGIVRRVANELPLIGWERSADIAKKFPTVHAMCDASEADWTSIPGIGEGIAKRVVSALNGGPSQ